MDDPPQIAAVHGNDDCDRRHGADRKHGEPPRRGSHAEPRRDADRHPQRCDRGEDEQSAGDASVFAIKRTPPVALAAARRWNPIASGHARIDAGSEPNGRGWSRKYDQTG